MPVTLSLFSLFAVMPPTAQPAPLTVLVIPVTADMSSLPPVMFTTVTLLSWALAVDGSMNIVQLAAGMLMLHCDLTAPVNPVLLCSICNEQLVFTVSASEPSAMHFVNSPVICWCAPVLVGSWVIFVAPSASLPIFVNFVWMCHCPLRSSPHLISAVPLVKTGGVPVSWYGPCVVSGWFAWNSAAAGVVAMARIVSRLVRPNRTLIVFMCRLPGSIDVVAGGSEIRLRL